MNSPQPPFSPAGARFRVEIHNKDATYVMTVPYRNIQMEAFLGDRGAQLRCEIPFRGFPFITQAKLYSGIHELWLFDKYYQSGSVPIFAGPIWDITVNSGGGVLSLAAQDALSYLAKRVLKTAKSYAAQQPADMMSDLLTYTSGIRALLMTANKQTSNAATVTVSYQAAARLLILDLFKSIAAMGDGVDYYCRHDGTTNQLMLYGGLKKPTKLTRQLSYGGQMASYSLQYNASSISNDEDLVSSTGLIGNAVDAAKQATYNALYQKVTTGSDLQTTASLNTAAAVLLANDNDTLIVPTFTVKALTPLVDFDFGDQFNLYINDEYAQYTGTIRVTGWQLTIGQGDQTTAVIYTNDIGTLS